MNWPSGGLGIERLNVGSVGFLNRVRCDIFWAVMLSF